MSTGALPQALRTGASRLRLRWSTERGVYLCLAIAITTAVVLGFARTFFFRAWYPEWARAHGAPETIFYVHGVAFAAWFLLLLAQTSLVTAGRVDVHHRLGWAGAALILNQLLRMKLAATGAWIAFAAWAVSLVSR